jgi:hypothetical protein
MLHDLQIFTPPDYVRTIPECVMAVGYFKKINRRHRRPTEKMRIDNRILTWPRNVIWRLNNLPIVPASEGQHNQGSNSQVLQSAHETRERQSLEWPFRKVGMDAAPA